MRNPEREVHYFRLRVLVAMAFVLFCFTLLGGRFAWLQVVKHEAYLAQAEAIVQELAGKGASAVKDSKLVALIAYLMRLGKNQVPFSSSTTK